MHDISFSCFFMVIVDILHRKKKTTLKFSSYVSKNDKKKEFNLLCIYKLDDPILNIRVFGRQQNTHFVFKV